jgi:putative transposase
MLRSSVISDDLWAVVVAVLPDGAGRRGRPWNDHRRTLEAIAWRFRTGSPWRDLPEQFGAWQSVWDSPGIMKGLVMPLPVGQR